MNDNLVIERVRYEDESDVVRLISHLGPRYTCPDDPVRTHAVFVLYVHDDRKIGLVARLDGEVVGVLLFEITPLLAPTYLHARADGMVVDPGYRGRGIGHRMLREALRISAERGVTSFLAKASNPAVIEMYRRMPELQERGVYFYHNPDPALVGEEGPA